MNFETLQLDSPEIPEACRDAYRAQIGAWPGPGEREPMAAVWAMAWLSKPEAPFSDEILSFLEDQVRAYRFGVSLTYDKHVEGGMVLEHGFRFMRRHFITDFHPTLQDAIEAAMKEGRHG